MNHYPDGIIGIDEVGRGCLAGPLVVGAVKLNHLIEGLTDSKLLSPKKREQLNELIIQLSACVGLGWASAQEIDRLGLNGALGLAGERALAKFKLVESRIILDGSQNYLSKFSNVETIIKADLTIPAVSAASIVAKVARDHYMQALSLEIGGYGFERNVGYGTIEHMRAIATLGISSQHRRSFEPIKSMVANAA